MEVELFSIINIHKRPTAMSLSTQTMSGHADYFHTVSLRNFRKLLETGASLIHHSSSFLQEVFPKLPAASWSILNSVLPGTKMTFLMDETSNHIP